MAGDAAGAAAGSPAVTRVERPGSTLLDAGRDRVGRFVWNLTEHREPSDIASGAIQSSLAEDAICP